MKFALSVILASSVIALMIYPFDLISALVILLGTPSVSIALKTLFSSQKKTNEIEYEIKEVSGEIINFNAFLRERVSIYRSEEKKAG